jgi:hypothetical protein
MAGGKKDGGWPPVAGAVLAVAALAMGALWRDAPLISSRPHPEQAMLRADDRALVPARLWQDPFEAIAEYLANHAKDQPPASNSTMRPGVDTHYHLTRAIHEVDGSVVALLVTVSGGSLPDDAESRTRTRYAVISALGTLGYSPEDDDGLGFAWFDPAHQHIVVPFEWYRLERPRADLPAAVLILWLDDKRLGETPLDQLQQIVRWVRRDTGGLSSRPLEVRIIGPRSSDTLQHMLRERVDGHAAGLDLYSPWATAESRELASGIGIDERGNVEDMFAQAGIRLDRTVSDDHALAAVLVDELALRGVRLDGESPSDVAIVTELDTFYGRAFPRTFDLAVRTKCREGGGARCDEVIAETGEQSRIHRYSYLKGLDGSAPHAQPDRDDKKKTSPDLQPTREELERRRAALERPDGDGQLDYLRRLADRIEATAGRLQECGLGTRFRTGCRRIRAIGVLGSDVYDKLLVLQALRPRFPDAIFFTTDLDALMLHPAETPWTRNLVVASGFGLSLASDRQGPVPPFRESYQTSVFAATLAAIQAPITPSDDDIQTASWSPSAGRPRSGAGGGHLETCARLFEVGRYGAIDLSQPCPRSDQPAREDVVGRDSLMPLVPIGLLLMGLVALGAVLVGPMLPYLGLNRQRTRLKAMGLLAMLFGTPVIFVLLARIDGANGEPFTLLDGVSVWPTEIVRVWTAGLAVWLVGRSHAALLASDASIAYAFGWNVRPELGPWRWLQRTWQALRAGRADRTMQITRWGVGGQACDGAELWAQYMEHGRPIARRLRVGLSTLIFLVVGYVLVAIFGPPYVPSRGLTAGTVDRIVLWLCVIVTVYLNFLVVDATRLCVRFVEQLARLESPWTRSILELAAANWGTDELEARELLRMWLIEQRTAVVGPLVLYPALVVGLMLVARSAFFDAWNMPPCLVAIFGLFGLYVVGCAVILRRAAQGARDVSLARLRDRAWYLRGSDSPKAEQQRTKLEATIERIEALSDGAFAPLAQNPIVGAVLVPSGSFSLLGLLEAWYAFR